MIAQGNSLSLNQPTNEYVEPIMSFNFFRPYWNNNIEQQFQTGGPMNSNLPDNLKLRKAIQLLMNLLPVSICLYLIFSINGMLFAYSSSFNNKGNIVFEDESGIYLYSKGDIVYMEHDGEDYEIYLYSDKHIQRLTDNTTDDIYGLT